MNKYIVLFLCAVSIDSYSAIQIDDPEVMRVEKWAAENPAELPEFIERCNSDKNYRMENLRQCAIAVAYYAEQISKKHLPVNK
jgi:hypothetical protein